MDDTQQSRTSEAAATRKRRSSILKSQRPARTPFSELEFNVATPTDTAKSRRVSFSRRTGVAEFVTNEATTTWKNFYEEHNKSMESSGNDSELNAQRQPIEHLGRRIFDQQFEEVEAVDFVGNLAPSLSANASINNINFKDIESVETADGKLTAPHNKFELSALTDQQSKLFGNDFTVTGVGEISGKIDFNFSNIQHIGERDDLEDIERDLERVATNVVCQGPTDRHNISEYIEVDLNMTNVARSDDCDMSITDTVSSPKVQDVSKSSSIDKKVNLDKDWITDKENIVVNPYAAPREADNFAVNDEPNQVLVFDGKRLTIQTDKSDKDRHSLLQNTPKEPPTRKTIVLNTNDDLPNFIDDVSLKSDSERSSTVYHERHDVCVQAVHKVEISKKRSILDSSGNISITQSLPTNIVSGNHGTLETQHSIVHKEIKADNISITQSIDGQIITDSNRSFGRRRTVVYENETGNISITQALPTNILNNVKSDKRKTIVFEEDGGNISITQGVTSQVILDKGTTEKRKTIVFDEDNANISITQALPSQVILNQKVPEKRKTIVFDEENANISITQALPSQVILNQKVPEKRKTIVFDEENANISITRALPSQVILNQKVPEKRKTIVFDEENANISITQALPSQVILNQKVPEKRKTIVFDEDNANISITQALPSQVILNQKVPEKRKTIVFEEDNANISITQALPSQVILNQKVPEKRKTIVFDEENANISITQALPSQVILNQKVPEKRKTIVFDDDSGNISITQTLPTNIVLESQGQEKRKTIIYEDNTGNISIRQEAPTNIILSGNLGATDRRRTIVYEDDTGNISVTQSLPQNIILGKTESAENSEIFDAANISMTQALPTNIILKDSCANKRRTIVYDDDTGNISITQAIPSQLLTGNNSTENDSPSKDGSLKQSTSVRTDTVYRRRTLIYDDEASDISMTQAIPANIILNQGADEKEQKEYTYKEETKVFEDEMCDVSTDGKVPASVFLLSGMTSSSDERVRFAEEDSEEVIDKQISTQVFSKEKSEACVEKRRTVVFADENCETEVSIMEAMPKLQNLQESYIKQDTEKGNLSLKKPIPDELIAAIRTDIINKSIEKEPELFEQANVSNKNVVVYQTATSSPSLNKIEQGDSNSAITVDRESNATASSKVGETDVTESLSSKNASLVSQVLSEPQVITPTSEIIAIKTEVPNTESETTHSIANDPITVQASKTSVLHNLLDMSEPILNAIEDKSAGANLDPLPAESESQASKESSMLYLIIDEDREVQTDKVDSDKDTESIQNERGTYHVTGNSPLSIEYKDQDFKEPEEQDYEEPEALAQDYKEPEEPEQDYKGPEEPEQDYKEPEKLEDHLQNALTELVEKRDKIKEHSSHTASSPDVKDSETSHFKSIKEANDTKELLDMICDFTDHSRCSSTVSPTPVENKTEEAQEPRRLSFATRRQSIIISREDLLNNISMAQAVLQKSRMNLDDTSLSDKQDSSLEDNQDSMEDCANISKKSARLSNEVVKTLHFDDESVSDNSLKPDYNKLSPLKKKTTFGETSFASENNRTRVIPSYLKDVSDGIKQLMSDLVKPMADAIPFENNEDRRLKKTISTVSTQIQANLITSSQIDMEAELSSDPGSRENIDSNPYYHTRNSNLIPVSSEDASEMSSDMNVVRKSTFQPTCLQENSPARVLVFDHNNPLNNILLGPLDYKHVHEYQPIRTAGAKKSDETLCGSDRSESCQINIEIDSTSTDTDAISTGAKDLDTETVVAQYSSAVRQENRLFHKPTSKDRAVDVHSEVENTEVNTVIAMKPNRELLETSSSLTLIEDGISESVTRTESKSGSSQYFIAKKKERKSLFRTDETSIAETENTTDDSIDRMKSKGKKRSLMPITPNRRTSVDITPKPNSKMLKISESPNPNRLLLHMSHDSTKMPAERDTEDLENKGTDDKKSERRTSSRGYNSTITIQQLLTDYQIDVDTNKEILDVLKDTDYYKSGSITTEFSSKSNSVTSDSVDKVCSFTSSKNHGSMKNTHSAASPKSESTIQSEECTRIDWHPELSSMAATKDVSYYDSGVNIVSKIDMLPFMGSHECERESSAADTWSFRLLHGRIRLMVRLMHRHDNATRTRVRADTPVTDVSVDTVEYDKKNPVAILCIRYACETMRYVVSHACGGALLARDVPLLLRRCAGVARVALRWGRAMHDAKLHLAYSLGTDGHLALKVANIPLRSVWEVSMDLELVVEHPAQAPWPRAGNVRVTRVVSDIPVTDEDVRRALRHTPNDWGHAPKTLWRMFRYLKHRQRDDELLLGA